MKMVILALAFALIALLVLTVGCRKPPAPPAAPAAVKLRPTIYPNGRIGGVIESNIRL